MANYTQFNLRGDTKSNWLNANPVLSDREIALETDTQRFKIGNGTSYYNQLPYGRNTGEYLNFYNVTALAPLTVGNYYTHETAILAVPSSERAKGTIISYETASGVWYTERFIGSDMANWIVLANWEKVPDAGDIAQLRSDVSSLDADTVQLRSDLNELNKTVLGDKQNFNYEQTSALPNLDYTYSPVPTYKMKAGDTITVYVKNIVADKVFSVYIRNGFTNVAVISTLLSKDNATLIYTADVDIEIDKIRLYTATAINISCDVEVYTALDLKVDKARQVIAGSGLTGGGTLEADRTINVVATDDSIVVAADGVKVDTQNLLTSTSATKPLAANQGKVLDEKITQIGADLNILDKIVVGDKQNFHYEQTSALTTLDYTYVPTPTYKMKAGDTITVNVKNIVADKVFSVYIRNGFTNVAVISTLLSKDNATLIYTADVDIEIDKIRLYTATAINISCDVEVYTGLGVGGDIDNLQSDVEVLKGNIDSKYAYSYDVDNLYVAYNNKNGVENTYWFKKCMANNLFTFYKVGYRNVARTYPSVDGISVGTGIIYYNETSSDNIGPISMQTGGFVGGNHLYNSTIKTAKTESYSISVDNKIINANETGYADNIVINVINTIYDPAIAPAPEATILSTPLSTETVSYVINKNTIEVGVTQSFSKTTTNKFSYYYGMQSMFVDENYVIAPGTQQYYDWTLVDNSTQLISRKNETTNFNRFIEKSTTKQTYQSSYLNTAFGLGKRTNTLDTNIIFSRSYAKMYHTVLAVPIDIAGKTLQWNGSYTFFKVPLLDSEFILAYQGTIRGNDAIFINSKKAFNGSIPVPSELALKHIQIIENNGFVNEEGLTTFELGGNGIYVSCASNASIIILFI